MLQNLSKSLPRTKKTKRRGVPETKQERREGRRPLLQYLPGLSNSTQLLLLLLLLKCFAGQFDVDAYSERLQG